MTANADDNNNSDRERLAIDLMEFSLGDKSVFAASAAQLRADEAEIDALRAENEALRTVTDEDVKHAVFVRHSELKGRRGNGDATESMRAALQSFIRSKESRRG